MGSESCMGIQQAASEDSAADVSQQSMPHMSNGQCGKRTVLYLFSGKSRDGSLGYWLKKLGLETDEWDIEAQPSRDLADDFAWQKILSNIAAGKYSARKFDGGPGPLRGSTGKCRYGFTDLPESDGVKVRLHNWFAIMTARAALRAHKAGVAFAIENPVRRAGKPSLFNLDELKELQATTGAVFNKFPQCKFGSEFQKETEILSTFDMPEFNDVCNCSCRWWIIPWNGESHFGPHPPLKGRQIAIPWEKWNKGMLSTEPRGPFLTRATAHYTSEMNKRLALAIAKHVSGVNRFQVSETKRSSSSLSSCELPTVAKRVKLTGEDTLPREVKRSLEDEDVVGGLRQAYKSVAKSDSTCHLGRIIRNLIDRELDAAPQVENVLFSSIGKPLGTCHLPTEWVNSLRVEIAKTISRTVSLELVSGCWDDFNDSVNTEECKTCLKSNFWKLWTQAINDPAKNIIEWLDHGAPAGLTKHPDLRNIFPAVDDDDLELEPENLSTNFDEFVNYAGVEDNPAANEALQGYISKGYLHVCETLEACRTFLKGEEPVLNKLGCIVKEKTTPEGDVVTKTRIILDAKQSKVTAATQRKYRSILPRLTDAVADALALASDC